MVPHLPLAIALFALRVVSPAFALLATLSLIPLKPTHSAAPTDVTLVVVATRTPRRAAILTLLSLIGLTYFLNGLDFVVFAVLRKHWPRWTGIEVNAVLGLLAFAGLAAVGAWKDVIGVNVWDRKRVKAAVYATLLIDVALTVLAFLWIKRVRHVAVGPAIVDAALTAARVLLLLPLLFSLSHPRVAYTSIISDAEEPASTESDLLLPHADGAPSSGLAPLAAKDGGASGRYGTFRSSRSEATQRSGLTTRANTPSPSQSHANIRKPVRKDSKEIALDPSWREIWQRLQRIAPYLWPSKSRGLQLLAAGCAALLVVGRVVNYYLPMTLGKLVESFEDGQNSPWKFLLIYVGLRYLQSSGGIGAVREVLWAPVMQYSDREMSQLSFDHLLNLSFAFHLRRKTGEVLRILDRGAAINRIFELLIFNAFPIFADITIALVVFITRFEWTLGIIFLLDIVAYMSASVILTRWRTKLRRQMNDRDVITRGIHTDCLLNYETVKYFNGEQHEGERYADAIRQYQGLEYRVITSLNILNLVQNLILALGLLVGSFIVALRVTRGQSKAADFVVFITFVSQLYGPLAMLGTLYRTINQGLVDTERLLKLLNEPTDVNDKPDALDLVVTDGEIEFDNVSFSYDSRTTALNSVSFKVPKGSAVALVGESGSGKSTILRLLYRFYDLKPGEGRILIDGQDIRDVTQSSLRRAIGVVPQDSVLFNASIEYNIGYGKFGASRDEIEEAARAAQMHDRISSFPDGYDTKVGERGVRLSGGEKQRVSIARTLLKNPPVLLLDEATSALDTSTEKDIQKALQNLVKGRSSLSIAHRLSTIASSDVILVLKDGQIVESGNHGELIAANGIFATMWADQIQGSEDGAPSSLGGDSREADFKAESSSDVKGYTATEEVEQENLVDAERSEDPEPASATTEKPSYAAIVAPQLSDEPTAESSSGASTKAPETSTKENSTPITEAVPAPVADETPSEVKAEEAPEPTATPDAPVAFPSSPSVETPAPVAFPASEPEPSTEPPAPVSFPTAKSDDAASQAPSGVESPPPLASPGVTFSPEVASPSPRAGTPDPNAEPKRKRISSQNFQRLARRISISGRRENSQSSIAHLIPGLKRGDSTPKGESTPRDSLSKDGESATPAEGSSSGGAAAGTESPDPSVHDENKKGKKKGKKEKRKTIF